MHQLDPALWRDMMAHLRRRHEPICRQWFEDLDPVDLDAGLLQIRTPNTVQQNYLQKKCLDQFIEAVQAVTGALVAVRFVTNTTAVPTKKNGTRAGAPSNPLTSDTIPAGLTAPARPAARRAPPARDDEDASPGLVNIDDDQIVISPDYSFENFITGPNNRLAYAAAVAVANHPGTTYNPLFIHGGVGLGKTHLLQAIAQKIMSDESDLSILYVPCEAFVNQFIECVQSGKMHEFRHRYRHIDVLIIDDIHFIGGGRERSQDEFFHTFNELYQSNRQIVLSSDAPPTEIPQLEERLESRFKWGLVNQVSKPDYETRVAILMAKARLRGITVPNDVLTHVARKIDTNARELEGAITTIQGHASLLNQPISLRLAQEVLGENPSDPRNSRVTLQNIIDAVTGYYNVRLSDLQSRRRHKSVTEPRQICMYLARKRTRFSLEEVGGYFGGRDHTTVMHSIRTVENHIQSNEAFAREIAQIDETIQRDSNAAP